MTYKQGTNQAFGLSPSDVPISIRARGRAWSRGEVGMLDIGLTDSNSTSNIIGLVGSGFANVVLPDTGAAKFGTLVLFLEDVAQNQRSFALLVGRGKALCQRSSGSIAVGDRLVAGNGVAYLDGVMTSGLRVVARACEAAATPTTARLIDVDFNGRFGFGTYVE